MRAWQTHLCWRPHLILWLVTCCCGCCTDSMIDMFFCVIFICLYTSTFNIFSSPFHLIVFSVYLFIYLFIFLLQKWYPMMSKASWSISTQLPESCWDTSGPVFQSTPRFWKRRWPAFSVLMWPVTFCIPLSPSAWSCRCGRSVSQFVVAKRQHRHSSEMTSWLSNSSTNRGCCSTVQNVDLAVQSEGFLTLQKQRLKLKLHKYNHKSGFQFIVFPFAFHTGDKNEVEPREIPDDQAVSL